MKQKKTMVCLMTILFVLVVVYAGLQYWNHRTQEKEEKEAEASKIYIVNAEELSAFSYTDGESQIAFVKEDGDWYDEEDKGIRMDQDAVETLENAIAELVAVRKVDHPDALKDYGLEEPSYTIQYTPKGDTEHILYIGNAVDENYYATTDDTGNVYTVSSDLIAQLTFDLASLVENDTVPSIGSGNLTKVEVTQNGKTVSYTEDEDLAQLAGGWGTLSLTSCEDYNVKEEHLEDYGLDEAERTRAKAIYTDSTSQEEETFTVYIGKKDDTGSNQYVMVKDSNMLYSVGSAIIDNMITVSEEEKAE